MKTNEPITDYAKLDPNASYSFLDYMRWQFKERVELIKGKLYKMSPAANINHQTVSANISWLLFNYFLNKPCRVFTAPFDVRLFPKHDGKDQTVVQPDLCVVCDENKLDKQGCVGPPDLIVEILSPSNSQHDLNTKFNLYQEAIVQEYWIVDTQNKTLIVYTLNNGKYQGSKIYTEEETFNSILFPELNITMKEVFLHVKEY
jgi:Uma2 family endonuclease